MSSKPAPVLQFRPRDGLTQDECNDMMAAMRPVMVNLCGAMGRRAAITAEATNTGARYVSAVCETEFGPLVWTLLRADGRFLLGGPQQETIAAAATLEDLLASVR